VKRLQLRPDGGPEGLRGQAFQVHKLCADF